MAKRRKCRDSGTEGNRRILGNNLVTRKTFEIYERGLQTNQQRLSKRKGKKEEERGKIPNVIDKGNPPHGYRKIRGMNLLEFLSSRDNKAKK